MRRQRPTASDTSLSLSDSLNPYTTQLAHLLQGPHTHTKNQTHPHTNSTLCTFFNKFKMQILAPSESGSRSRSTRQGHYWQDQDEESRGAGLAARQPGKGAGDSLPLIATAADAAKIISDLCGLAGRHGSSPRSKVGPRDLDVATGLMNTCPALATWWCHEWPPGQISHKTTQ